MATINLQTDYVLLALPKTSKVKLYEIIESQNEVFGSFFLQQQNIWMMGAWDINTGQFKFKPENDKSWNLIESIVRYSHLKIDDPVIVWNDDDPDMTIRGHFAGISKSGKPTTFGGGNSSWTVIEHISKRLEWDRCVHKNEIMEELMEE